LGLLVSPPLKNKKYPFFSKILTSLAIERLFFLSNARLQTGASIITNYSFLKEGALKSVCLGKLCSYLIRDFFKPKV